MYVWISCNKNSNRKKEPYIISVTYVRISQYENIKMWTRLQMSQTFELGRRTVIEMLRNYKETFQLSYPQEQNLFVSILLYSFFNTFIHLSIQNFNILNVDNSKGICIFLSHIFLSLYVFATLILQPNLLLMTTLF